MTVSALIPARVKRIVPSLGSMVDGEALGACRAIGRTLTAANLDFHDLAEAISVEGETRTVPVFNAAGWRAARSKPAPPYQPSRRKTYVFTPKQSAEHRRMATWCRNHEAGRLTDRERAFVADVSTMRRELSLKQADWLCVITDRLAMEARCAC